RTPGIEVRPLRQINGVAHFNEVFLTDVRVPRENIVGEINGGWGVAQTTMANERTLIGSGVGIGFHDILQLARATGPPPDAARRSPRSRAAPSACPASRAPVRTGPAGSCARDRAKAGRRHVWRCFALAHLRACGHGNDAASF